MDQHGPKMTPEVCPKLPKWEPKARFLLLKKLAKIAIQMHLNIYVQKRSALRHPESLGVLGPDRFVFSELCLK